jgi:hypothetical protein
MNFVAALSVTCPQSIVPALPLAQTSAASDEEDDRLIKSAFQKWAIRLTSDPAVIRDDETRSFVESDFGVRCFPFHLLHSLPPVQPALPLPLY